MAAVNTWMLRLTLIHMRNRLLTGKPAVCDKYSAEPSQFYKTMCSILPVHVKHQYTQCIIAIVFLINIIIH